MEQELLKKDLLKIADTKISDFSNKLKINVEYEILGIKSPNIKQIAKDIVLRDGVTHIYDFLDYQMPLSYEEVIITYFVFAKISNKLENKLFVELLNKLLKFNNSWATNDTLAMAIKPSKKKLPTYFEFIEYKLKSDNPWDLRFSVVSLMSNYLENSYVDKTLNILSSIKTDNYYVQMALGWAFATALAKQYEKTYPYLFNKLINKDVNKIAIQKAIESRRISESDKTKLRRLRSEIKESS